MTTKFVPFLMILVLSITACSSSVTILSTATAVSPHITPVVTADSNTSPQPTVWKTVRDARYGFVLAVPCWWPVSPIPADGIGGVMTIKNYDEAYFNAHSTKGFWDWPNDTLKLDVVVMEGVDPSKSDAEAYEAMLDSTAEKVGSVQTQQTGQNTATVLTIENLVNPNDQAAKLFVYRLAADKLLAVSPTPQNIIDTPDFQAILASLVLKPTDQVVLPTITPAPALISANCTQ